MAASSSAASSPLSLLLFSLLFLLSVTLPHVSGSTFKDVDMENPVWQFHPSPLAGSLSFSSAKDAISCERIRIAGFSRFEIKSYANSFRVALRPSELIPERHYNKIEVCFHRNASIALCQCAKDKWKTMQNGLWSSTMSPFEDRFIDVKFTDGLSGSITVSLEEESHQWRLLCLCFGVILLLLAPFVSQWVPFYYSSSMALGILLIVLIILFQGMKLLPTGRKNIFYLTIYGSVLGAGSFLVHHFSMLVNSMLVNFGLSEDMHNPVSIFLLVGIFLAGAALGYWIVHKFVLSDDGTVDDYIAQFVKWAMRVIAIFFFFESTLDILLAVASLSVCWGVSSAITSLTSRISTSTQQSHFVNKKPWQQRALQASAHHKRAEFLSKSPMMGSVKTAALNKPNNPYTWSTSPQKAMVLSSSSRSAANQQDYYSSFHKIPDRRKLSKKEWEKITRQATKEALAEWASSPEFTDWIVENADRIRLIPDESSEDDAYSGSESEGETTMEGESGISLFKWY